MAIKYHCRKCGKRFVEWGAAKFEFKCPDCEGEELVRVGGAEEVSAKRPTLKRRVRRPLAAVPVNDEDFMEEEREEIVPEDFEAEPPIFVDEDEESAPAPLDDEESLLGAGAEEVTDEEIVVEGEAAIVDEEVAIEGDIIDEPLDEASDWTE